MLVIKIRYFARTSTRTMTRRLKIWLTAGVLAIAIVLAFAAVSLPYLPFVHGTTDEEVERLAAWLQVEPGMRVADFGAGDGTFAIALASRVGPSGRVYATEIDRHNLAEIRERARSAGLTNVTVVEGTVSDTKLPEGCCDAVFTRNVYHHLTEPAAINADLFRAVKPDGRLLVIDFAPGGVMDWFGDPSDRHGGHGTRKETVSSEVSKAGFELARGPEAWRGRLYAVLFTRPGG